MAILRSAIVLACGVVFCGCSSKPTREEAAVDRILKRPPPGSIRLINISGHPLRLQLDANPPTISYQDESSSPFFYAKAGEHRIKLIGDTSTELDTKLPFESGQSASLVAYPSGKAVALATVTGEQRMRQPGNVSVYCYVVGGAGSAPVEFSVDGQPNQPAAAGQLREVALAVGDHKLQFSSGKQTTAVDAKIADSHSYTFYVRPAESGIQAFVVQNTPSDPGMAGAQGAG